MVEPESVQQQQTSQTRTWAQTCSKWSVLG